MAGSRKKSDRANINDVAKLSGVSIATAARVFNKKWEGKIRPETRQKVLDAAKELNYFGADAFGSILSSGKSNIIALVVGANTGYFYLEVIMKFVRELGSSGRQVMIFEANPAEGVETIIEQVQKYRVDAMIITASATKSNIVDDLSKCTMPIIAFNRKVENHEVSAVYCDERAITEQIAEFLIKNNHKNLAVISGNANVSQEHSRIEGFCLKAKQLNANIIDIKHGDYTYESGFTLAGEILEKNIPDAFFCVEDTIAMGAIDAVRKIGLKVPDDVSVIGFDNISVIRVGSYNLTSVKHPVDKMIAKCIEILNILDEKPNFHHEYIFDMQIVERNSVKLLK